MRIGVFGGAFDPIHLGHLLVADDARRRLGLDRVLLVPTSRPPHRPRPRAPFADRMRMVEVATRGWPGLEPCGVEGERPGRSYTVDTLRRLRARLPGARFWLLLGADQYRDMAGWHEPRAVGRLARIAVLDRPGQPRPRVFRGHDPRRVSFVPVMAVDLSAAQVRARLARHRSVGYMLATSVSDYIRTHRPYC